MLVLVESERYEHSERFNNIETSKTDEQTISEDC